MSTLTLTLTEPQEVAVNNWRTSLVKKLQRKNGKTPSADEVDQALTAELIYSAVVSRRLETQIIVAKRQKRNAKLVDLLPDLKIVGKKRGPYKKKDSNKTT